MFGTAWDYKNQRWAKSETTQTVLFFFQMGIFWVFLGTSWGRLGICLGTVSGRFVGGCADWVPPRNQSYACWATEIPIRISAINSSHCHHILLCRLRTYFACCHSATTYHGTVTFCHSTSLPVSLNPH